MNLKEVARDLIALGSLPFFIIVLARTYIGNYMEIFYQLILSLVLIYLVYFVFRKSVNTYASMIIPLVFFTSLFYMDIIYTIFVSVFGILALASLFYLKFEKQKIICGIINGIVISGISYYVVGMLV